MTGKSASKSTRKDAPVEEVKDEAASVKEAHDDVPTSSDSDSVDNAEQNTQESIDFSKIASDMSGQLGEVVDRDALVRALKSPGNRAIDEWGGMVVNGLKGLFEGVLGKRGDDRDSN